MLGEFNGIGFTDNPDDCEDCNMVLVPERRFNERERYRFGQCHALALAICMERPGFTLASFVEDDGHILAVTPDGLTAVDVDGLWSMDEPYTWDEWGREFTLYPLTWEGMVALRDDGYDLPCVDAYTRRVARRVLADAGL